MTCQLQPKIAPLLRMRNIGTAVEPEAQYES